MTREPCWIWSRRWRSPSNPPAEAETRHPGNSSVFRTGRSRPRKLHVPYFQLHADAAVVFVDGGLDGQIEAGADGQAIEEVAVAEGDALDELPVLADVKLEVVAGAADAAGRGGDFYVAQAEHRTAVRVAERAQPL
jgi:hypothetical protein